MEKNKINSKTNYHLTSLNGIFIIIKSRGKNYSYDIAVSISITILIYLIFYYTSKNNNPYQLIANLAELTTSIFPNLLGFSLGGYAMVIGFPNNTVLEETAKKDDYSTYQKLSAFFSIALFIQLIVLGLSFLVSWFIKQKFEVQGSGNAFFVINIIVYFMLSFLSIYSLIIARHIIINLFNLGQINSAYFTREMIKKENKTH
jgi:hypothetical protein